MTEPTQHVITIDCGCWKHSDSQKTASAFSSPEALAFLLRLPLFLRAKAMAWITVPV
jgi:hypothetical protein